MRRGSTVPLAPGGLPLLGHAVAILRSPLGFLSSLPDHGGLVRVRVGPLTTIVVCDPALTLTVLRDDKTFDKGGPFFDRVRESMGDGIAACPHDRHRRLRRLLQPAFHSSRHQLYADTMTATIGDRIGTWRDGQTLGISVEMLAITARTLAMTMFSTALTPQELSQVVDDITTTLLGLTRRMVTPPPLDRLPTPANRRYQRAMARLRRTFGRIISDRRANDTDTGDVLSALLTAVDPEDPGRARGLSDPEIMDMIMTLFLAGSDTTASGLTYALYLVSTHPDVERSLHTEADVVLRGGTAGMRHLPDLRVTSRIITEVLRAYPPAWLLTRATTTDTTLGGHRIPAGTTVTYCPYLIHRRRDAYPDPDHFDPTRWVGRQPPRDAFIPFGGGARKCVGDWFGETEAILALASIAARWTLRPAPGYGAHPSLGATLGLRTLQMTATCRTMPAHPES